MIPSLAGGGQERGLRSGTLAPALCVGMGEAARICSQDMAYDSQWIQHLSEKLKRYYRFAEQCSCYVKMARIICWLLGQRGDGSHPDGGAEWGPRLPLLWQSKHVLRLCGGRVASHGWFYCCFYRSQKWVNYVANAMIVKFG